LTARNIFQVIQASVMSNRLVAWNIYLH